MHIKYVCLDGFKSYRDRTNIGPFDPHFNAITGLNGSGKSNILDAIAFVLGLSSLNVVRAGHMNDLIFKGGGVSRAIVSVVFDNKDKRPGRTPIGYEKFDEIIVARTVEHSSMCKYFLNSVTVNKKTISDLFESVQLNIANPNFMIFQGKITKVVNMKPKELLHMIEETVGATVYQTKRDKTQKELDEKEKLIEGVEGIMSETVFPAIVKQRKAADDIQEYKILTAEKNELGKEYAITAHIEFRERLAKSKQELEVVLSQDKSDDNEAEESKETIKALKSQQQKMKKESSEKFKGKIEAAEKELNAEKKTLLSLEAKVNSVQNDVKEAEKKVKQAESAKKNEEKQMANFKAKSGRQLQEFDAVQNEIQEAEKNLALEKEKENNLKMGNMVDDDGKVYDIRKELNAVEEEELKIRPDYEVGIQKQKTDKQQLKNMEQELKKTPSDDQIEKDWDLKNRKLEQLKTEAARMNINTELNSHEIESKFASNRQRVDVLEREKQKIWSKFFYLSLFYDKTKVNPTSVLGSLFELIKIKDIDQWGAALDVCGGGIFGHVVTDNEHTAKNLLKNGGLKRRTTIHALSVFRCNKRITLTQAELDRKLGPGKAIRAIDLLEYEPKYKPIVENFFGNKVLCDNLTTAKIVAFEMKYFAVSLEGDSVDPDGIMQGGARQNAGANIRACDQLYEICRESKVLQEENNDLQSRLQTARANDEFMKRLDAAKRELHHATELKKLTKYSQLKDDTEKLRAEINEKEAILQEWSSKLKQLEKQKAELQHKEDHIEQLRTKTLKDNANAIKKWEKALEAAKKKYDDKKKQFNEIDIDIKSREALIADCQKDIDNAKAEVEECKKELAKVKAEYEAFLETFRKVEGVYEDAVAEGQQWNEEYNRVEEEIRRLEGKIHENEVHKLKRNNQREALQSAVEGIAVRIEKLEEDYKDIKFNELHERPNPRKNATQLKKDYDLLCKKLDDMRLTLDNDSANLLQQTKSAYKNSQQKVKQVHKNKKNLYSAIRELDAHKMEIVMGAYDRINTEFNRMMSTLLPESEAKLVLVNPDDLTQGLNIHVRLGGVWKESLTELSGGQRSLVALALVLSLCMYSPAPFYILDEIDAALDLSHTQNIGCLIKQQFRGTQFICVSLKDGMYTNANVLFQTMFQGGQSTVKRCVRSAGSSSSRR